MFIQMLLLAMDRNEILRLDDAEHELLLLLTGVAGYMDVIHFFVDDLRPQLHQLIDHLADSFFIAGDRICRNDDAVVWAN